MIKEIKRMYPKGGKTILYRFIILLLSISTLNGFTQKREYFEYKPIYAGEPIDAMYRYNLALKEYYDVLIEKVKSNIRTTKDIYSSIQSYPLVIPDGWHSGKLIEGDFFFRECKFLVKDNKIKFVAFDNFFLSDILFSSNIEKGKGIVKAENGHYQEAYFLDFCLDNTSSTTPPIMPGAVTFWTNWKRAQDAEIYIGDTKLGKLSKIFSYTPSCQQNGSVVLEYKPGRYEYSVIKNAGKFGEVTLRKGIVNIVENQCSLELIKK